MTPDEMITALRQEAMLLEAADMLEARIWQPIETAPRDGTRIIGLDPTDGLKVFCCFYGEYYTGQFVWFTGEYHGDMHSTPIIEKPTHWMPLPEPPETPEGFRMITEGRMEHLEAIADQIEKYEKWEPKWDIIKSIMSAFGGVFLAGCGVLIPITLSDVSADPDLVYGIIVVTIASLFGCLVTFIINCVHNRERKNQYGYEADKIRNILNKVKGTVVDNP